MILFYTQTLLLLRRPPCWNKHGAARTTRRACRDVTWRNKWNLGLHERAFYAESHNWL